MSFHYSIEHAPQDPIFAVAAAARRAGHDVIDASVGMIADEHSKYLLELRSVRKAANRVFRDMQTRGLGYAPLLGVPAFRAEVQRLVFGENVHVASTATAGGTAALALNLHLLQRFNIQNVLLPLPTWPAHHQLIAGSQLKCIPIEQQSLHVSPTPAQLLDSLSRQTNVSACLLQASGHNPTGHQWTTDEWQQFANGMKDSRHAVLLDCAYQGLGEGVEEDVAPVALLRAANVPLFLSWSASKNHTIYGLRTGLSCAVVNTDEEKELIEGHYQDLLRAMHSSAPLPGQLIVSMVQQEYRAEWMMELQDIRDVINVKREKILNAFPDWAENMHGSGLFAILPLTPHVIQRLRNEEKIFVTDDGRINIAAIPLRRFDEFIEKLKKVL